MDMGCVKSTHITCVDVDLFACPQVQGFGQSYQRLFLDCLSQRMWFCPEDLVPIHNGGLCLALSLHQVAAAISEPGHLSIGERLSQRVLSPSLVLSWNLLAIMSWWIQVRVR